MRSRFAQAGTTYELISAAPQNAGELADLLHKHRPRLVLISADKLDLLGLIARQSEMVAGSRMALGCDWLVGWDAPQAGLTPTLAGLRIAGCIEWQAGQQALAEAFEAVLAGELAYPRQVLTWIVNHLSDGQADARPVPLALRLPPSLPATLTEREAQIYAHLRAGLTNKEIAAKVDLGLSTVKKHLAQVFRKRGIRHRRQGCA